ncbi:MAG TPA: c-type cytochrome [Terracidiphilus sp.]|nr:c-type cytochrome [Terracidiphilus sp.]
MTLKSLIPYAAAAAVLAAAIAAVSVAAQAPQAQPQAGGPPPQWARNFPAPTNLKVLPKNLTGAQVREVMEKWQGDLGVHCNTCHAEDPKNMGPNGRPRLNFADDSKPEKQAARLMYTMTNKINDDTISMVDEGKGKVTCGTCHRGHLKPEEFVPPPEEHRGPPPGGPGGQPPVPR